MRSSLSTRRRRTLSIVMATLAAAMTSPQYDVFSYHGWQRFTTDPRWHQGRAHMREQRTGPRRIEFAERGFAALDTPRAREARESFTRGAGRGSGRRPGLGASEARSACGARASTGRAPRIVRGGGGDGCGRPASAGGIVSGVYDGSGSDFLSGTISEGDSSSRFASINARRIFSITVISV